jgi:glycosyltransferase involved in cell wall biosynthesis
MPTFYSIITPVYNAAAYLPACLDSLLAQTYPHFELLLIDDGSTDESTALCDAYQARDGRIRVIHKENEGPTRSRYVGLQQAQHDYVCFVDSDDHVLPSWLETIHTALAENHFPDMLLFGLTRFDDQTTRPIPPQLPAGFYDKERLQREVYPYMLYDERKPFYSKMVDGFMCARAVRRSLCLTHYIQDMRITMFEDTSMMFQCLYGADSLAVIHDCPYYYRTNPQSIVGRYHPEYVENLQRCNRYMKENLGQMAPELMPAINAYIAMRAIDAIAQEFLHDRPFGSIVSHIGKEMSRTGLARDIDTRGLPAHIRLFIGLLKHRFYALAVWLTKLRMPSQRHTKTGKELLG